MGAHVMDGRGLTAELATMPVCAPAAEAVYERRVHSPGCRRYGWRRSNWCNVCRICEGERIIQ